MASQNTRLCEDLVCDQQSVRSWFSRLDEAPRRMKNLTNRDKVSHLIANIGDEGFQHLRGLTAPEEPNAKSHDDLKKLLTDHLDPSPNPLGERFKFLIISIGCLDFNCYVDRNNLLSKRFGTNLIRFISDPRV